VIIERERRIRIVVEQTNDRVFVRVTGKFDENNNVNTTRTLAVGDEMIINYQTLSDASEVVEAAVLGALALEEGDSL
jgi:hypothetical protein